jgi:hypothetical protein
MQTTLDEIQWLEMASCRFWVRVYEVKAQTGCSLELAIKAVQMSDRLTATHR